MWKRKQMIFSWYKGEECTIALSKVISMPTFLGIYMIFKYNFDY
jgi:hypothetical protein